MILVWTLVSIVAGFLTTELIGYFVHTLLHSEKIPYLSKSHMVHHLKHYGPKMAMRADAYKISTQERASIGGVGFEWLMPIASICIPMFILLMFVGIPISYLFITFIVAIAWGVIGFNYMHDAMHLKKFWMLRHPWLSKQL